jgi:hypothetical protein
LNPYLKEDKIQLHYSDEPVNAVWDIIALYSEDYTKPINAFCGQQANVLKVK